MMSKYTMTLAEAMQQIEGGLFNFPYEVPEEYKPQLEERFTDFYLFHEIAFETVEEFRHYLKNRFQLLGHKYSALYITEYHDVDFINNYDMTETSTDSTTGTMDTTATTSDKNRNVFRDTPQGMLENLDMYATEVTDTDNTNDMTNNSNTDTTTSHTLTRKGNIGVTTVSDMIRHYRDTLINVELEWIADCADLFMLIY